MMIKIEEQSRGYIATRALDAGIQNALFADIRTADDVRECVRFVRPETPEAGGRHGAASRRINVVPTPLNGSTMNDAVLAFMIEKRARWTTSKRYFQSRRRHGPVRPE